MSIILIGVYFNLLLGADSENGNSIKREWGDQVRSTGSGMDHVPSNPFLATTDLEGQYLAQAM